MILIKKCEELNSLKKYVCFKNKLKIIKQTIDYANTYILLRMQLLYF